MDCWKCPYAVSIIKESDEYYISCEVNGDCSIPEKEEKDN